MNAIVVRSPRTLSRPRPVNVIEKPPATAVVFKSLATTALRGYRGATALAQRAQEAVASQRESRWINTRQVDAPEPLATLAPAKPRQVRIQKFWDIFD